MLHAAHQSFNVRNATHTTASQQHTRISRWLSWRNPWKQEGWTPAVLTWPALTAFIILFASILIAVVILQQISNQHDGFRMIYLNHYAWTYGPVAILTIVTSLWRLVDYNCKGLIPWAELQHGSAHADRTLLLDYLSPLLVVSLWDSAKKGHIVVVLTILCFVSLKFITLASTGLLLPETVIIGPVPADMRYTTKFDNTSVFATIDSRGLGILNRTAAGASVWYSAYGTMVKGLPDPEGISQYVAYETIRPVDDSDLTNKTYSANVRAFVPRVTCDSVDTRVLFEVKRDVDVGMDYKYYPYQIQNTTKWTCANRTDIGATYDRVLARTLPVHTVMCPPRQLVGGFGQIPCRQNDSPETHQVPPLFIVLADLRYSQLFNISLSNHTIGDRIGQSFVVNYNVSAPKVTAALCQISYEMHLVPVTYSFSTSAPRVIVGQSLGRLEEPLSGVSSAYLLNDTIDSLVGNAQMFATMSGGNYAEEYPNSLMRMMATSVSGNFSSLLDESKMRRAAEDVLKRGLVQMAHKLFLPATNATFTEKPIDGKQTSTESHLRVQSLSASALISGTVFAMVVSVLVLFIRPTPIKSGNPQGIITARKCLSQSALLHQQLFKLSHLSEEDAGHFLRQSRYTLELTQGQSVSLPKIQVNQSITPPPSALSSGRRSWWNPFTLTIPILALTFFLPLIAIALLEILQHLSDRPNQALASLVGQSDLSIILYTRIFPTSVMLLIATLYNSLDFNTSVMAPFMQLKSQPVKLNALGESMASKLPFFAWFFSIRYRLWVSTLTISAAFIGSILGIVVSGLYTVERIPQPVPINLIASDQWNLSFHQGSREDNGAAATSSLIESTNLSFPAFTFGDLVFPTLSLDSAQRTDIKSFNGSDNPGTITARVPALRPRLSCTVLEQKNANFTVNTSGKGYVQFYVEVPLPANCHRGSQYGNSSVVRPVMVPESFNAPSNTTLFARYADLHMGPYGIGDLESGVGDPEQPDNPPGCPSVLLAYGVINGNDISRSNVVFRSCYHEIDKVDADVTFTVPGLGIVADKPPVPIESTVQPVYSSLTKDTGFWWRLQDALYYVFQMYNTTENLGTYGAWNDFWPFYHGVFYGRTPLSKTALADPNAQDLVFDHIQQFHNRYVVQYMSSNMRSTLSTASGLLSDQQFTDIIITTSEIQGNFTPAASSALPWLVQHPTPKIILQAMLAVMFLFGFVAWLAGTYHTILPWNPCTIAGTMILLAGSKICEVPISKGELDKPRIISDIKGDGFGDCNSSLGTNIVAHKTLRQGPGSLPLCGTRDTDSKQNAINIATRSMLGSNGGEVLFTSTVTPPEFSKHPLSLGTQKAAFSSSVELSNSNQDSGFFSSTSHLRLGWWEDGVFVPSKPRSIFWWRRRYEKVTPKEVCTCVTADVGTGGVGFVGSDMIKDDDRRLEKEEKVYRRYGIDML